VKRLDKLKDSSGEFGKYRNATWEPFSDFSHGGMRQVSRWNRPDAIASHHRDEDVIDAMTIADMHGLQASMITSMVLDAPIDEDDAFHQSIVARYLERKGKRPPSE
jgi:hypothetical protein